MQLIAYLNVGRANIPENCTTELVCRSGMLTVWRRLHIEVDSMGESVQNRAIGTVRTTTRIRSGETVVVPLNPTTPAALEPNRFEGGRFYANFRSFAVNCDLSVPGSVCNTADTVTVRGTGSVVTLFADTPFELYDDDDFNDNNGPPPAGDGRLDGDTGEDIPLRETDLALLTANSDDRTANILATAYIRPVYDITDPTDDSFFQANADGVQPLEIRPFFNYRDLQSTNTDVEFWSIYILGSYQSAVFADYDPPGPLVFGQADGIPTTIFGDGSGVAIHQEAHSSKEIVTYPNDPADPSLRHISTTVGHEVGHLLSGQHRDGGIMTNQDGIITSNQFSPVSIRRIRELLLHP